MKDGTMRHAITKENMFDALLEADPSFARLYQAFLDDWADEGDPPQYLALADLARHLIGKLQLNDTAAFPAVFGVVEVWNIEGDHHVQEMATVGLLENLQNEGLHRTTQPSDFLPWLGSRSRVMWDRVKKFWKDGTLISSD